MPAMALRVEASRRLTSLRLISFLSSPRSLSSQFLVSVCLSTELQKRLQIFSTVENSDMLDVFLLVKICENYPLEGIIGVLVGK
jgi:hypothetical protein